MKIGNISVDITGNLQPLADSMQQAQSVASSGAAAIAGSFNQAAGAANVMVSASAGIAESAKAAAQAEQQAGDAAASAAAKIIQLSDAAQAVVDRQTKLTDSADRARAVLDELQAAYARGAASAEDVARAESDLERAMKRAGEATEAAASPFDKLLQKIPGVDTAMNVLAAGGVALLAEKLVSLGADALKSAEQFEEASNQMERATGATGAELEGMKESLKSLYLSSAQSLDAIAGAMVTIKQHTGAAGDALESLTSTALKFAKVAGVDLKSSVEANQKLFEAWNVDVQDQARAQDMLYVAYQKTGVSVTDLANALRTAAPILKDFGFSFEQSLALVSQFSKATGQDAATAVNTLRGAFAAMAEAGKDPLEELQSLIERMQGAATNADALNMAVEDGFSKKAAPLFVDAVKSGAFNLQGLQDALDKSAGSVTKMAASTTSLSSEWTKFTHGLAELSAPFGAFVLKPLADSVQAINILIKALDDGAIHVSDIVKALSGILGGGAATAGAAADIAAKIAASKTGGSGGSGASLTAPGGDGGASAEAAAAAAAKLATAAKQAEDSFKWLPSVSVDMAVLAAQEKQAASELQSWISEVAKAGGLDAYWHKIAEAEWAAVDALPPAVDWTGKFADASGLAAKSLKDFAQAGLDAQQHALDVTPYGMVADALKAIGLTADGVKDKTAATIEGLDIFFRDQDTKLPAIQAAWGAYGAQIEKLAAQGVPSAIRAWNDYDAALQRAKGTLADVIASQEQHLQVTITQGVAAGKAVGDEVFQLEKLKIAQQEIADSSKQMSQGQIIALANMSMAVQAHRDAVNLLSDSYKMVQKDIVSAFDGLGQAIGKDLANFKSFHQEGLAILGDLEKAVGKLAEKILSDLVGNALKTLGESLASVGADALKTLTGIGSGLLSAPAGAVAASGAEATKLIDSLTGAGTKLASAGTDLTGAAGKTAGAAGSLTGAAGSLMGTIGAIGSVVGALASIGTMVVGMETNHKLAVIEGNTRISAILAQQSKDDAWSQFGSMYDRLGEALNAIRDVTANIVHVMEGEGNVYNRLGDLWNTLQSIDRGIGALETVGPGSGGGGGQGGASDDALASIAQTLQLITQSIQGLAGGGSQTGSTAPTTSGRGGAYVPSSLSVEQALQQIAQGIQMAAQMESDIASAVKDLATQDAGLANALKALADAAPPPADPALLHAVDNQAFSATMNTGVIGQAMDAVASGTVALSQSFDDMAKLQDTHAAAASTQQSTTNAALSAINQATGQVWQASSSTASASAQIADATAATASGIFDTVQYLGVATDTAQTTLAATQATAATTSDLFDTAKLTEGTAKDIREIVQELGITTARSSGTAENMSKQLDDILMTALYLAAGQDRLVKDADALLVGFGFAKATEPANPTGAGPGGRPITPIALGTITAALADINRSLLTTATNTGATASNTDTIALNTGARGQAIVGAHLDLSEIIAAVQAANTATQQALPDLGTAPHVMSAAAVTPGLSPFAPGSTATHNTANSAVGSITFNISGAQSPREIVREIHKYLRGVSPVFSASAAPSF